MSFLTFRQSGDKRRWLIYVSMGILLLVILAALLILILQPQSQFKTSLLTTEEQAWLESHPDIRIAPDPNFPPIEYFDENGQYEGLIADYFEIIQKNLGVKFHIVQLDTWDDVIINAKNHQIDAITAAQITPERSEYMLYTHPIVDIPNVIIVRNENSKDIQFQDMNGMTLAITNGNALHEYVQTNYPHIIIVPVRDDLEALETVSFKKADATVVNMAIASYLIEKHGIANLRIAGDSGKSNPLAIASRKDEPILNSILDKGLASVSERERNEIYSRWVHLETASFFFNRDFLLAILGIAGFITLILLFILLWNKTLLQQVEAKTSELNRELSERKKAEEKNQSQFQRLTALRQIDNAISSSLELSVILNILLQQVTRLLNADAADVLLLDPDSQRLEYSAGIGFLTRNIERAHVSLGDSSAGIVALERRTLAIFDINTSNNFLRREEFAIERFISYFGTPLIYNGKVKGVLEVFMRSPIKVDHEWLNFLETIAGQAAIAIHNAELFEDIQRSNRELIYSYEATIESLSKALDLRDQETEGHSRRVTETALELARVVGLSDEEMAHFRRGAMLHDIGKIGVPDRILLKAGPLNDEEWVIMRKHPVYAYELLSPITFLKESIDIPYCHHEKWDGSGYPRGLSGENIPLAARIFAIADVWDALLSDRPYRPRWTQELVLDYIHQQAGKHFDPYLADVFLDMIEEKTY